MNPGKSSDPPGTVRSRKIGADRLADNVAKESRASREQRRLLDLLGALDWEPGYDYKPDRERSKPFASPTRSRNRSR
jgi:hypothetical protein